MPSDAEDLLSVSELSALSGTPEKTVRNEVDRGVIRAVVALGKNRGRVKFPVGAVAYFLLKKELDLELSPGDRKALYQLIATNRNQSGKWRRRADHRFTRGTLLTLNGKSAIAQSKKVVASYYRGLTRIERCSEVLGGEPVFKGTRLSVRHIGGMARGGFAAEEILKDYPHLTEEDVEFAKVFASMKRSPGRPSEKRLEFRVSGAEGEVREPR